MEWALAILFGAACLLLILSFVNTRKSSKEEQQKIEYVSISMLEKVQQLQNQIRNIELDMEITAQEVGINRKSSQQRVILRKVLDLHKRGYSFESIAVEKKLTENEVERLLTPYMKTKIERRKVANDT